MIVRIAAALLSASLVVGASPAMAQSKYYMRERIVGLPASSAAATPPKKVATACGDFTRGRMQSGTGSPAASVG